MIHNQKMLWIHIENTIKPVKRITFVYFILYFFVSKWYLLPQFLLLTDEIFVHKINVVVSVSPFSLTD